MAVLDFIYYGLPNLLYIFNGMAVDNKMSYLQKMADQFQTLISTTAMVSVTGIHRLNQSSLYS